ncbi:MAG: RnfABCDGE type electron transport complex subunit G [Bacteroidetes bacterium]|nr:MAG: RnfABCDGE type electron transport complex subunit G [Bacteroidota bacterium]
MAKKESNFINMVLALFIVTASASFILATVYNLTAEPIAQAREAKRQFAISQVVPEFDRLESKNFLPPGGGDSLEFNFAFLNDELVGIAVNTWTNRGYSGRITAMVGFDTQGNIVDVVHLQHAETPGLGDKIEKGKSDWSDQFKGLDPSTADIRVAKDNGDIDAITAATITARAYCDAIQRAYDTFKEHFLSHQPQTEEGGLEL